MIDKISQDRIALLHPKVRNEVNLILNHINTTCLTGRAKARVAQGLRTFAEQDDLYAQGRSKSGQVVTNAKGGQSMHNYGLAVDIVLIIDGKVASWDVVKDWDGDKQADWMEVVAAFKRYGWSWGGDWRSFKDMPHFEKTFGKSLKDLQNLHAGKKFIPGTTYVNI